MKEHFHDEPHTDTIACFMFHWSVLHGTKIKKSMHRKRPGNLHQSSVYLHRKIMFISTSSAGSHIYPRPTKHPTQPSTLQQGSSTRNQGSRAASGPEALPRKWPNLLFARRVPSRLAQVIHEDHGPSSRLNSFLRSLSTG